MTAIACAGPKEIYTAEYPILDQEIAALEVRPGDKLVSGAQFGVDTYFIEQLYHRLASELTLVEFREVSWHLTVPAAPCNAALVLRARERRSWTVEDARAGANAVASYMLRNDLTQRRADWLLATPPTAVEVLRGGRGSGTWSTIRRFRKAGKMIRIVPLDGSEPWVEPALERLFG